MFDKPTLSINFFSYVSLQTYIKHVKIIACEIVVIL